MAKKKTRARKPSSRKSATAPASSTGHPAEPYLRAVGVPGDAIPGLLPECLDRAGASMQWAAVVNRWADEDRVNRPRVFATLTPEGREVRYDSHLLEPPTHSTDFSRVNWYGTSHYFTARQAKCVAILWANLVNGTPQVRADTLLKEIESESLRLRDVFRTGRGKQHPAWKTMIVEDAILNGCYRLNIPSGDVPPVE